jgi:four helix bundle protein
MENRPGRKKNEVLELAFDFALAVIAYTELLEADRKYNMANQLFRCGTSIHANIREAQNAESKLDFIHKMKIAAKEADEAEGWIDLCHEAPSYPDPITLAEKLPSVLRLLNSIIATSKRSLKSSPASANRPIG